MSAAIYNIIIDQGSDWAIQLTVKENGVAKDLTGYSARAQMRTSKKSGGTVAANFVAAVPTPSSGIVTMALANAASSGVTPAVYYYDLEIYTAGDANVTRLIEGTATLKAEVTRP